MNAAANQTRRLAALKAQQTRGLAGRMAAAAKALQTRRENEAAFGELVDVSGARCTRCGEVGTHECGPLAAARAMVNGKADQALVAWGLRWVDFCAGVDGAERPYRTGLNEDAARALELQLAREFGIADPEGFATGDDLQRLRRRSPRSRRGPVQAVPESLQWYRTGTSEYGR